MMNGDYRFQIGGAILIIWRIVEFNAPAPAAGREATASPSSNSITPRVTGRAVNIPFTVSGHHRSGPSGTLCCVSER